MSNMSKTAISIMAAAAYLATACTPGGTGYDASGIFETTEVIVSAKGTGELVVFSADEGQALTAGQEVGCIDTLQLHLKRMQLLSSLSATASRRLNESRQVASTRQQITNLQQERKRFAQLVRENAANQKQVDDIDYQIRNSVVTSPISGTILTKYMERGEFASPGKPLFKVADTRDMQLRAYISASQLTTLKLGQKVKVLADQGRTDRKEYAGTVVWIADQAEFTPKTIQTRDERANLVYAVKIAVKNDGLIKDGMYGDVVF